ncbi:putative damage-inducible protein DinB [Epilithonimonas hungarica]|uniref:DinB family protein n=1 Tax=Epilithonimonas hungarica TaxID=454006 RepID=UPI00278B4F21|nr:DinB family protein [Epilithonimonas hungarica]MDP9955689.1 putative damage-inducible protein DinB [Epilithonimonas hungarica]
MKEHFIDLLEYNSHFNQLLIESYLENKDSFNEKMISLINHILNAQQIWNSRIIIGSSFGVWQINPDEKLLEINQSNFKNSIKILNERNLDEIIVYKNSKGDDFQNSIQGILFHFINHSTYHRGQLAMLMKQAGLEPINTDYIFYKRN